MILDLLFLITMSIVAVMDYQSKLIKNRYILMLFLLGVLSILNDYSLVYYKIIGIIFPSSIIFFVSFFSNGKIGGGDIKLVSAIGFYLGVSKAFDILLICMILLLVFNLISLMFRRMDCNTSVPLGPFFYISYIAVLVSPLLIYI